MKSKVFFGDLHIVLKNPKKSEIWNFKQIQFSSKIVKSYMIKVKVKKILKNGLKIEIMLLLLCILLKIKIIMIFTNSTRSAHNIDTAFIT